MHLQMKQIFTSVFLLFAISGVLAQTSSKPAKATHSAGARAASAAPAPWVKLPPGVPPGHALVKTAFSLRYQDLRIGKGAEAEPNKLYKVQYTGWLAADGRKFDSSYDRKEQVLDSEGKPVLDADGKPKMEATPLAFPQGFGRLIPGFDQGLWGMKVGGKRRLFIPWQLAYGARGGRGIPPKADLSFDIEFVDQTDLQMQMPMGHPGMSQPQHATPPPSVATPNPGVPPPAGTPPPTTPPTGAPPAEKQQSN